MLNFDWTDFFLSLAQPSTTLALRFTSPGPYVWQWGENGWGIRWYGLLIAIAVLVGVVLSQRLAQKRQVSTHLIADLGVWLVLAAIPCARLYYVIFQWDAYSGNPIDMFAIWKGGIAIHGAILGGTIATLIFAQLHKVPFWQLADLIAPSLILGQAIGRWGNFFNSEAFGVPTDLPWKLYISPQNRPLAYQSFEYFHPTFLYEFLWNLFTFVLLMVLFRWSVQPKTVIKTGTIALAYMMTYSLGRIWIEGLRTDSLYLGDLRVAQLVSLTAVVLGGLGLFWLYWFERSLPDVAPESPRKHLSE